MAAITNGATQRRFRAPVRYREFEELVEAREQPWERQIEGDAEAGKLDQLAEEALRDYLEGKCIQLL
jgi:hypothetical protein